MKKMKRNIIYCVKICKERDDEIVSRFHGSNTKHLPEDLAAETEVFPR